MFCRFIPPPFWYYCLCQGRLLTWHIHCKTHTSTLGGLKWSLLVKEVQKHFVLITMKFRNFVVKGDYLRLIDWLIEFICSASLQIMLCMMPNQILRKDCLCLDLNMRHLSREGSFTWQITTIFSSHQRITSFSHICHKWSYSNPRRVWRAWSVSVRVVSLAFIPTSFVKVTT